MTNKRGNEIFILPAQIDALVGAGDLFLLEVAADQDGVVGVEAFCEEEKRRGMKIMKEDETKNHQKANLFWIISSRGQRGAVFFSPSPLMKKKQKDANGGREETVIHTQDAH